MSYFCLRDAAHPAFSQLVLQECFSSFHPPHGLCPENPICSSVCIPRPILPALFRTAQLTVERGSRSPTLPAVGLGPVFFYLEFKVICVFFSVKWTFTKSWLSSDTTYLRDQKFCNMACDANNPLFFFSTYLSLEFAKDSISF